MRFPLIGVACTLACLSLAPPAFSQDEVADETTRWVPSIGAWSSVLIQETDAKSSSSDVSYNQTQRTRVQLPRPPFQSVEQITVVNFTDPLQPAASGDDRLVTATLSGTLELMTPGFQSLPGRPRFFAHGDLGAAFAQEHHVVREGVPGSLSPIQDTPDGPLLVQDPGFTASSVQGVGSQTSAEIQPFLVSAGAGIAFSFDLFGRRIRIKPSIEYLREEIEVTGTLVRAVLVDTGINVFPPLIPLRPSLFIPIEMSSSTKEFFHGLGPGLEIEMDTRRAGPFVISLFASAQFYKIITDTEVKIGQDLTLGYPQLTPTPQTVSADWTFEKDPWSYRAGVGLRFRWLPE